MKKILLSSAFIFSTLSFAQLHLNNTRFGLTAGLNYSRVENAHNPSGARYTFQGGVLALIPMGKSNQFFIQPEVLYYGAGETGKDKDVKGKDGYNAVYANNYLSVPLYLKGYFSESESEFFGMIGPRFNFLIDQNVKNAPIARPYYAPDVTDPKQPEGVNGNAKSFNWSLGFGLGYSYKRQLELVLRYDLGLLNTYPGLAKEIGGTDGKKSEQVIALTLNYLLK
ncbi:porin family protein [Chryseobacterium sp. CBSDS_008]|uniref:porin family protein n=1 Tax=Chryseobacterium sp. CBSDS_008 TaxID=3415265 RepID=UPI003CF4A4AB